MHATYPVVIRHHPGWFGVLAGVILGVALTIGGLWALDRLDLGAVLPSNTMDAQTAAQLYTLHQAREYGAVPVAGPSAEQLYQLHLAREYGTMPSSLTADQMYRLHLAREYGSPFDPDDAIRDQFIREHQADMVAP